MGRDFRAPGHAQCDHRIKLAELIVDEFPIERIGLRGDDEAFRIKFHRLPGLRKRNRANLRPKRAEHPAGRAHQCGNFMIDFVEEHGLCECQSQPAHAGIKPGQDIRGAVFPRAGIITIRSRECVIDQRRIFHTARQRTDRIQTPAQWVHSRAADLADRRFKP